MDYSFPTTLIFPATVATIERDLVAVSDGRAEGTETAILTVVDMPTYDVGVPASATVTITD